jgi:hypothetical protein
VKSRPPYKYGEAAGAGADGGAETVGDGAVGGCTVGYEVGGGVVGIMPGETGAMPLNCVAPGSEVGVPGRTAGGCVTGETPGGIAIKGCWPLGGCVAGADTVGVKVAGGCVAGSIVEPGVGIAVCRGSGVRGATTVPVSCGVAGKRLLGDVCC